MKKIFWVMFLIFFCGTVNAWLFTNQPYRIPININSPSVLTDYPILVDLNNTSLTGDTNTHFWLNTLANGNDIRFSNQDDNVALDFFKETFFDNQRAKFWVEIKNISSGDQNIYLYYGNQSADNNSNWENTFLDDGNGTTMLGWTTSEAGGSAWTSTGVLYQNTSNTGTQHMSRSRTFSNALAYAVSVELQADASADTEIRYFLFDEANGDTAYVQYTGGTDTLRFNPSGDDASSCSVAITDGGTYDVNVTRSYDGNATMYVNGNSCSLTNTTDVSGTDHGFSHAGSTTGRADSVYLKKTNGGGEPTYSLFTYEDNGVATIRVVDEETQAGLQATVLVNGLSVDVNSSGFFDLNISTQTFPLTIVASLTGYDTRTFTFLTGLGLITNSIIGLRDEDESKDIGFIFYSDDETTLLPNRYIAVKRNGILSGIGLTGSTALINFNLAPQDGSYSFNIFSIGSDTNIELTYLPVTVTVNQPKDELLDTAITPNSFNLDVGGLGLETYNPTSLPISTIIILGNTVDSYTLRVADNNADGVVYLPRYYLMQTKGDVSTLTIQPYLIRIVDGTSVIFKVADISTNQTIPGVRIQMSKGIDGVETVVEDNLTNSAGIIQVSMQAFYNYNLLITNPNQDTNYFNQLQTINASHASYTFWINYSNQQSTIIFNNFDANFFPSDLLLTGSSQTIDINSATSISFTRLYNEVWDGNRVIAGESCTTSPCNSSFLIDLTTLDNNSLQAKATIQIGDNNYTISNNYFVAGFTSAIVERIQNLKNELGTISLGFLSFVIVFSVLQFVGSNTFGNNIGQIFLVTILFGALTFLWFLEEPEILLGILGAYFGVFLIYVWSRNRSSG